MFPIVNVGPLAIQAAGFFLILSVFIGTWLTSKFADGLGTNTNAIENSILTAILVGIFSARLGFMLQNPSVLQNNPLNLISLTPSMLDASFGVLVGILTGFILAQKKNLPLWPTLDTLTPLILLVFVGIHLANYANGNAYGIRTELPWGIHLWNAVRHPVQLYAALLGVILIGWLLFQTRLLKSTGFYHSGLLFSTILSAIALITLFTRAFNAERILLGRLDFFQLMSFIFLLGGLGLFFKRAYPKRLRKSILIGMGSNLNPKQHISKAAELLSAEFRIRRKSGLYLTEPVKGKDEAKPFLNRVIEIETELTFDDLVNQLKAIEKSLGREPGNKIRVALDLDVLTYGSEVFVKGRHQIPDPDIMTYRYIAAPLAEMSPDFRHPANGLTIQEILDKITDKAQINKLDEVENGIEG